MLDIKDTKCFLFLTVIRLREIHCVSSVNRLRYGRRRTLKSRKLIGSRFLILSIYLELICHVDKEVMDTITDHLTKAI